MLIPDYWFGFGLGSACTGSIVPVDAISQPVVEDHIRGEPSYQSARFLPLSRFVIRCVCGPGIIPALLPVEERRGEYEVVDRWIEYRV